MAGKASIYGLYDKQGNLRYIGKANNPKERLKSHMRDSRRRKTPVYDWIKKHGLPDMRVLAVDCDDWRIEERRLIAEARARGDKLLNLADGGDQPLCNTEQSRVNAKALNERLKADPAAMRLRDLKRAVMSAHRRNHLSDYQRSVFRSAAIKRPDLFACFGVL